MQKYNLTMTVLFSHGYFLHEDPKERVIMRPYPPLGILYLSAWLEKFGVDNAVFDTTFSDKNSLKNYLLEHRPPIVALYANLMTKLNVLEIIQFIRTEATLSGIDIVLGGPDVTYNVGEYLAAGAHIIVLGEGEQTMLELAILRREQGAPLANHPQALLSIPGLAFRMSDGATHRSAIREKMRDLADLPFPARHKIDLQQYLNAWKSVHAESAISVSTQRGCPYTCRWCSTAVYGQSYRRRSPEAVADEIEWLQQHYEFDLIWFVDDVFTVSHKWLQNFRQVLTDRKIRIRFECITRADRLTEEIIHLLRDCGCFRVWIGAESGSQRILDAMDRRVDAQQVRDMIVAARRAGMMAGTFIMLGYPGETETDIVATLRHLKESNPDLFTISVAYPIKGTGLYESVEKDIVINSPWAQHTDRDLDFTRSYARPYYHYAVRWTVNAVYLHKAVLAGKSLHPRSFALRAKVLLARAGMWRWRYLGRVRKTRPATTA